MKSKYAERVETLVKEGLLNLHGDRLLVEVLSEEEKKTASGLIVEVANKKNSLVNETLALVRILAVGEGYYMEQEGETKFVALSNKAGDNVIVSTLGMTTCKEFFGLKDYKEYSIGLVSQENVHATVKDANKFLEILKQ